MQERDNILRIFRETKKAIEERDSTILKSLSNQTINTASLTNDPDNIAVAVIVYSIGKILERNQYFQFPGWKSFYENLIVFIDKIIFDLEKNNDSKVAIDIKSLTSSIKKSSGKLRTYIQDVFRKASINKASKIYEHGISMERTASLLGITLYELAGYVGQKSADEIHFDSPIGAKQRIKMAMEMFK